MPKSAMVMCALTGPEENTSLGFAETCAGSACDLSLPDGIFTELDALQEVSLFSVNACLDSTSDKLFGETTNGLLASL